MNSQLQAMMTSWQPVLVPYTERQYQERIALLNKLIDGVGENQAHPLATLLDIVGVAVTHYEQIHYPVPASTSLCFFNKARSLSPRLGIRSS